MTNQELRKLVSEQAKRIKQLEAQLAKTREQVKREQQKVKSERQKVRRLKRLDLERAKDEQLKSTLERMAKADQLVNPKMSKPVQIYQRTRLGVEEKIASLFPERVGRYPEYSPYLQVNEQTYDGYLLKPHEIHAFNDQFGFGIVEKVIYPFLSGLNYANFYEFVDEGNQTDIVILTTKFYEGEKKHGSYSDAD